MRWFLLALLGIVIAAGVSIAASRLASQQIGLASQPISAGDALAPTRQKSKPRHITKPGGGKATNPPSPTTQSSEPAAPAESPPVSTAPGPVVPSEPGSPQGHDGEQPGGSGGGEGADD